ncbi:hypothetical protein MTO96_043082 [Rhipicephalus appendiculatus]
MTGRNDQAAGRDPDPGPAVVPEAGGMKPRLRAEPSPDPGVVVGPHLGAHHTRGADPGTHTEQSVSRAHLSKRCRVAPGLTRCATAQHPAER